MKPKQLQLLRWFTRTSFFILFCVAPIFNIFRFDLHEGHFYFLTFQWSIGIGDDLAVGQLAINLLIKGLIPIVTVIALLLWLFYKYGRLYCGWLCPHFSVVELNNSIFRRAIGKLSIWDKNKIPESTVDGIIHPNSRRWLPIAILSSISMAFLWTVVLLTYVLNPSVVYSNLIHGTLSTPSSIFLMIATLVLSMDFLFARHLFCRFGCAAGMFQSLAWMANRNALVINLNREKKSQCRTCNNECEHACPMRLKPRGKKRMMFSCTQCTQCLAACDLAQKGNPVLRWSKGYGDDSVAIPVSCNSKSESSL